MLKLVFSGQFKKDMTNRICYKGYVGTVEISVEDNILHGKVLGLTKGTISYEGETVAELHQDFRNAVDDYLDLCKQEGWTPETPCKGSFNVRVGQEIHAAAKAYADNHNTPLNNVIVEAVNNP